MLRDARAGGHTLGGKLRTSIPARASRNRLAHRWDEAGSLVHSAITTQQLILEILTLLSDNEYFLTYVYRTLHDEALQRIIIIY
jgi:hypothetical protein